MSRSSRRDEAAALPPAPRLRARVEDRSGEDEREHDQQDDATDGDPLHPGGVTHDRQRHEEGDDQREDVAGPVAEHRTEGTAGRYHGRGGEPARPQEVADPERQDVVRADPAQHEGVEAPHCQLERVGDEPPARTLRDVHALDHDRREQNEAEVGAAEGLPDGVEVGIPEDEPEEERRRCDADGEQSAAAPAGRGGGRNLAHCGIR